MNIKYDDPAALEALTRWILKILRVYSYRLLAIHSTCACWGGVGDSWVPEARRQRRTGGKNVMSDAHKLS
jgi:hypothetical protein